jgi:hypothetical protein
MASITLLSIPLFILKGAAIGNPAPGRICIQRCTPGCIACPADLGRQRVCLRAVRGDGRIIARHLLGDRLGRVPEMRKRLFRLRGRDHSHRRHPGILLPPSIPDPVRGRGENRWDGCSAGIGPGLLL